MKPVDLSDPSKVSIQRKDGSSAPLTPEQLSALAALTSASGDLGNLSEAHRAALAGLQAKFVNDPGIVGAAVITDFSLRVVSIHKTWSWFKHYSKAPGFDPAHLTGSNLTLDKFVKKADK